jgi:hypothetical protein
MTQTPIQKEYTVHSKKKIKKKQNHGDISNKTRENKLKTNKLW